MSRRRQELSAASSVLSVLMTGAFILQDFGFEPILDHVFRTVAGTSSPLFYSLAIASVGAYAVLYNILYILVGSPLQCRTDFELPVEESVTFDRIEAIDFVNLWLMSLVYIYLLIDRTTPTTSLVIGGLFVILTSQVFNIIPRIVANKTDRTCFWGIKIVAISIPISVLLYLPTILVIVFTNN